MIAPKKKRSQRTDPAQLELPFGDARLALLAPIITPPVRALAEHRLQTSENLFKGETLRPAVTLSLAAVKLALLLVQIMNPFEDFSFEEEALMRGISSKTLRTRRAQARDSMQPRLR